MQTSGQRFLAVAAFMLPALAIAHTILRDGSYRLNEQAVGSLLKGQVAPYPAASPETQRIYLVPHIEIPEASLTLQEKELRPISDSERADPSTKPKLLRIGESPKAPPTGCPDGFGEAPEGTHYCKICRANSGGVYSVYINTCHNGKWVSSGCFPPRRPGGGTDACGLPLSHQ